MVLGAIGTPGAIFRQKTCVPAAVTTFGVLHHETKAL